MFFKIGALKSFAIFWIKKSLQHRCFPVNITKFLRTALLQNFSSGCFCIILKVIKQGISQKQFLKKCPCYDVLMFFSSQHVLGRHIVWCIKSRTRLFTNFSSISRFSKYLYQGVLYKAEKLDASSHEQYFSKHHFLDICQCALTCTNGKTTNLQVVKQPLNFGYSSKSDFDVLLLVMSAYLTQPF